VGDSVKTKFTMDHLVSEAKRLKAKEDSICNSRVKTVLQRTYICINKGSLTSCPGQKMAAVAAMCYSRHHKTLHSHHLLNVNL